MKMRLKTAAVATWSRSAPLRSPPNNLGRRLRCKQRKPPLDTGDLRCRPSTWLVYIANPKPRRPAGASRDSGRAPPGRRGRPLRAKGVTYARLDVFLPVTVEAMITKTAATTMATIQRTQSIPSLPFPPKAV